MKKYLLLLFFACSASLVMAQAIEASPEMVTIFEQGYLSDDDRAGHSTMTNTAMTTKTFDWVLETICNPANVDIVYCDKQGCYLSGTVTGSVTLEAGESGPMDLHVDAGDVEYPIVATVTLTDQSNSFNNVTVTFEYGACDTPVGTEEIAAAKSITLFPNPATTEFTLSENTVVENVVVYNMLGAVVKRFQTNGNNTYDIADLNTGIYMLQLLGEDGELLRTMKMNKGN